MKVQEFIQGAIRKLVHNNYKEENIRSLFSEFAISTINKIIEENVGKLEEEESQVIILSIKETKDLLVNKMQEEESQRREMKLKDAWSVKNYTIREILNYMEKHN
jgi:hypothetical protein